MEGGGGARDPSTLAALRPEVARELRFKRTRSGARPAGSHLMRLRRISRMPESSREYLPGDPVNLIDWQAYARTDQLLVRLVRDEAPAEVVITMDASETMQWPGQHLLDATVPTKAEVALRIGLHLASLHLRLGDVVSLRVVPPGAGSTADLLTVPARGATDVATLFSRLEQMKFSLDGLLASSAKAMPRREKKPSLAYWIGDALGSLDAFAVLEPALSRVLVHVLSSLERQTSWVKDGASYFDESRGKREYQGVSLRPGGGYEAGLGRWLLQLEQRLTAQGGAYIGVSDATRIIDYHAAIAALPVLAGARP